MNKFIKTLKNIWSIEDLRQRILFTIGLLAVFRLGTFLVLPGIDGRAMAAAVESQSADNSLVGLISLFTGGAFSQASVFALGIMPYISASIIVQLLGFAVPYFQRLQKTEGESGRKKINQITRLLTVAITLVQGGGYLTYVSTMDIPPDFDYIVSPGLSPIIFWATGIIILSTGTIFAMWLGEKITDRGIGNGVSLLITIGIIAALPGAFGAEIELTAFQAPFIFLLEMIILFAIILVTVMLSQAIRKIPVQYAKRVIGRKGAMIPQAGERESIPIKVIAAGVMPIIFAQALMFLPATLAQYTFGSEAPTGILKALSDFTSWQYNVIYFFLVVLFTYVYTALIVNPKDYAEYLKRQNAFIPGIKPGAKTAEYIDAVVTRITLPGAVFLGFISVFPAIVSLFGVNPGFAMFFGGTSLLIIVGVVLDTLQQVESHLVMRKYDGLIKSGRLRGRSRMQDIGAPM